MTNQELIKALYTAYVKKDWNMLQPILAEGFVLIARSTIILI